MKTTKTRHKAGGTHEVATLQTEIAASARSVEPTDLLNDRQLAAFAEIIGSLSHDELDFSMLHSGTVLAQQVCFLEDCQAEIEQDGPTVSRPAGKLAHPTISTIDKTIKSILALKRSMGLAGSSLIDKPARNRERRAKLQAKAGRPSVAGTTQAGSDGLPRLPDGSVDWKAAAKK
ncbi:MAG: hypothetical protein V7723_19620 [Sneathiella sp.]|uniref:hypothetical protein n=1 Tax=Sneathiella sp. TaxID=1964365 RepID=UPI00300190EC